MTAGRTTETVDVAVVGGGVAGAAVARLLARSGVDVLVLERAPAWRWRAGGVFASPATVAAARRPGRRRDVLDRVTRPIPAMRVETPGGAAFELTYGAEAGGRPPSASTGRAGPGAPRGGGRRRGSTCGRGSPSRR